MQTYAPCPRCGNTYAAPVTFTLWGGLLGPKLLTHVQCHQCGMKYNGKSGQSNLAGIVIYTIVVSVISLVVLGVIFFAMRQ